ncbi:MAG: hypothetical protein AAGF04_02345 [Chlamydiota bacterium]
MNDLTKNNVICFKHISRKKEGFYAHFQVKAESNGVVISAQLTVDLLAHELNLGDVMEKIIAECAKIGLKELKKADYTLEGLDAYLGVAQLG